jgi:hypothetical protein
MNRALRVAGLTMLVLGWTSMAFAQTDCKTLVPASPWGPNDQTGATNRVTPAVTKAAAAEIQDGKVVPMSYPLTDGVPLFTSALTSMAWATSGARTATSTKRRWGSTSTRTI